MFDAATTRDAMRHAEKEYPREACGVVTDAGYEPAVNVAECPEKDFALDTSWYRERERRVKAIIHSHPDGNLFPSAADMRGQETTAVPWGIIVTQLSNRIPTRPTVAATRPFFWGDQLPTPDFIGRSFRHGVTDCYSLIRDWYRAVRNISLPVYPRDWSWWEKGDDLYQRFFADAGFYRLDDEAPREVGDVFLAAIRSKVPNHGGIALGEGQILHHPGETRLGFSPGHLSLRQPVIDYKPFIKFWIRYR
jgi:proteasome lid subunit RPN8/RPN11